MPRCLIGLLLGVTFLLPGLPAAAADDALSLGEAVRLTRARALSIQANRQHLAGLQAQRDVAAAAQLPTVGFSTGANYRGLFNGLPQQNLDNTTFPLIQSQGPGVDTTLSASQLLFDQAATANTVANASDQVAIGQLAVAQAELTAMEATAVAYLEVLRAQSLEAVASDAVSQAQSQLRFGQARLKAGAGTRVDVLQLQARLAQTEDAWLQAQNAVALARLILGNTMNQPLGERPLVALTSLPFRPFWLASDLTVAMGLRPDARSQTLRVGVAERQVQIDEAGLWPTVNATGRATQRNLMQAGVQAGVELTWPVYDGSRVRSRAMAARHALEAERVQFDQMKLTVELEVRQAELRRREAQSRRQTVRRGVAAAQEAYRIVVRRFELGLATVVDVTNAQTVLIQARQDETRALYDLAVAEVRLRRALGEDLATFTAAPALPMDGH
jgi:outer membrane protein